MQAVEDIVEIVELDHSPIPGSCLRRLDEVTVRRDGQVWRVHNNDPDPFPSKPHADNLESGLKMDLSNGALYLGRRATGKAVSRDDLLAVRAQVKKIQLPPLAV